ncbi:TnpV protein [Paenibacillus sp. FSL K6-2524]|uniref:TnpV protein n=1 Tax=Paenibacillus sp. FSL K6-2524 TaxID=2954516 RepID=UPI0030F9CAF8
MLEPIRIGKYGMLRKTFLKDQRKGTYAHLMLSEQLNQYLADIDRTAREQIDLTMQDLLRQHPAPDKATDPMGWTGHMNSLKQQAEELILTELIYH